MIISMQAAEKEIREIIEREEIGEAMSKLFDAYSSKDRYDQDSFVAVLIGRIVAAEGLRRALAASKTR